MLQYVILPDLMGYITWHFVIKFKHLSKMV